MSVEQIVVLGVGTMVFGLFGKLIYDGIKPPKARSETKKIELPVNNAKQFNSEEFVAMLQGARCGAHEHLSSGVSEMIILQKESQVMQREQARRLDELAETMKENFTETFERMRSVERRIADVEGEAKVLHERTLKLPVR